MHRALDRWPVVLDGGTIMEILGIGPGPTVGEASRHLNELASEHGALTREEAMAGPRDLIKRARETSCWPGDRRPPPEEEKTVGLS
ncbi:hypothetical protein AB4Z54_58810, partial [Streptomyces sp. MCAF7]